MRPVSAHDVAAELRRRVPGIGTVKLHKLLYYCQGHHLADLGEPLFSESVSAWDMGPVVGALWKAEKDGTAPEAAAVLDEGQLNTVGYVISRYGALSGSDLKKLTHAEAPWIRANNERAAGGRVRIEPAWMASYFRDEVEDPDDPDLVNVNRGDVAHLVRNAAERAQRPTRRDTRESILAALDQ